MAYNSYYLNIVVRLLLILLTMTGLAYLFANSERFFTLLFLALLAILQTILLFVYLNRTNRNLARFLLLLTQEDTSVVAWKGKVEKTFKGLHHSFLLLCQFFFTKKETYKKLYVSILRILSMSLLN